MATATKATAAVKTAATATRTPIELMAIHKRKLQQQIDEARVQNPYTSYSRDELVLEFNAAAAELDRLVDEAIAAE